MPKEKQIPDRSVLLNDLSKGKYPEKEISTDVGMFVIRYPSGSDNVEIQRRISIILEGRPRNSYPADYLVGLERDITLSVLTQEYPNDFPEEWKGNFVNYPLWEVKNSIAKEFSTFCGAVRERIQGK